MFFKWLKQQKLLSKNSSAGLTRFVYFLSVRLSGRLETEIRI